MLCCFAVHLQLPVKHAGLTVVKILPPVVTSRDVILTNHTDWARIRTVMVDNRPTAEQKERNPELQPTNFTSSDS